MVVLRGHAVLVPVPRDHLTFLQPLAAAWRFMESSYDMSAGGVAPDAPGKRRAAPSSGNRSHGPARPLEHQVYRCTMTNSNLVGCSTGRSPGLAPFRILCTHVAARRKLSRMLTPYAMRHVSHGEPGDVPSRSRAACHATAPDWIAMNRLTMGIVDVACRAAPGAGAAPDVRSNAGSGGMVSNLLAG